MSKLCDACNSNSVVSYGSKTSDGNWVIYNGKHYEWYLAEFGIGSGDYVDFEFCHTCGRIQGFKPLTKEQMTTILAEEMHECK